MRSSFGLSIAATQPVVENRVEERGLGTEGGRLRVREIVGSGGRKHSIENSSFGSCVTMSQGRSLQYCRASMCIVLDATFPIRDDRYQHRPLSKEPNSPGCLGMRLMGG